MVYVHMRIVCVSTHPILWPMSFKHPWALTRDNTVNVNCQEIHRCWTCIGGLTFSNSSETTSGELAPPCPQHGSHPCYVCPVCDPCWGQGGASQPSSLTIHLIPPLLTKLTSVSLVLTMLHGWSSILAAWHVHSHSTCAWRACIRYVSTNW